MWWLNYLFETFGMPSRLYMSRWDGQMTIVLRDAAAYFHLFCYIPASPLLAGCIICPDDWWLPFVDTQPPRGCSPPAVLKRFIVLYKGCLLMEKTQLIPHKCTLEIRQSYIKCLSVSHYSGWMNSSICFLSSDPDCWTMLRMGTQHNSALNSLTWILYTGMLSALWQVYR